MLKLMFIFLSVFIAVQNIVAQDRMQTETKITGYIGAVHPLYTFGSDVKTQNFTDFYSVGIPTGINFWKTENLGISFEVTPYIRNEKGISKTSNVLFHPGVLYKVGNGFTIIGRAAFETSGRYGFTPIVNKVIKKFETSHSNLFAALLFPTRFGNAHAISLTVALQVGIGF
jgi:hypothetical protein